MIIPIIYPDFINFLEVLVVIAGSKGKERFRRSLHLRVLFCDQPRALASAKPPKMLSGLSSLRYA